MIEAFARLRPINRLPKQAVENIAAQAYLYQASAGESLMQRISDEKYVHYLLDGSVQIFCANSKTETLIASDPTAKNALGRITKSAQDIVANCPSTLGQLPWEALEKFLIQYAPAELSSTLEVQEILSATSSDWMVRLLQSDLFSMLPAGNIQKVLASIEFLETDSRANIRFPVYIPRWKSGKKCRTLYISGGLEQSGQHPHRTF